MDTLILLSKHFILAYIATIFFSFLFNVNRSDINMAGLAGAFGWTGYILFRDVFQSSSVIANFVGGLLVALSAEILARINKKPVTVYAIPGIIPLVPGYPIYRAMIYFLNGFYTDGIIYFIRASFDAGAIAIGLLVVSVLARIAKNVERRRKVLLHKINKKNLYKI